MQIGMIGLGRMGANMVRRLMRGGHDVRRVRRQRGGGRRARGRGRDRRVVARGLRREARDAAVGLADGAGRRSSTRRSTALAPLLHADDIVIDGGNSYYRDDIAPRQRRSREREHPLHRRGHERRRVRPRARLLPDDRRRRRRRAAPRPDLRGARARPRRRADRTPGRGRTSGTAERRATCTAAPAGAGHFVKMVHNGIEYGMMAAYAEGLNILHHANVGAARAEVDAETTPLREPELYHYEFDLPEIAEVWRRGSVIASWLLDLTAAGPAHERRRSRTSAGASRTRARAAGRRWRPSTPAPRRPCSRPRSSPASPRAARPTSATARCRPCAWASAATWSSSGPSARRRGTTRACRRGGR